MYTNSNRRGFLIKMSALGASAPLLRGQEKSDPLQTLLSRSVILEQQAGDPGEPFETLNLQNPGLQKANGKGLPGPKKAPAELGPEMVEVSLAFVQTRTSPGVSRDSDPNQVTEFLNLCDFDLKMNGKFVPYCAAGVSYAACRAYCNLKKKEAYSKEVSRERLDLFKSKLITINAHYFFPSASVQVIKADAQKRGTWRNREVDPQKGWLVVFSWNGGTLGNHIGLVKSSDKDDIHTVEYNTSVGEGDQRNGGVVAEKVRRRNDKILGYINLNP